VDLERVLEEEPRQAAVDDQLLARGRDVALQAVDVEVDLVVEFGVQVQLKGGHAALLGQIAVEVADADAADPQPLRQQGGDSALATAEVAVEDDGPCGCHVPG
jgi:hypothetical protein